MRSVSMRFMLILTIMALPAFPGHPLPRLGLLAACLGVSLALGARWLPGRQGRDAHPWAGRDAGSAQALQLAHQLREVIRQTEQASLEINECVLRVIGRARVQQRMFTDAVGRLSRQPAATADGTPVVTTPLIESLKAETASLAGDVNGVLMSLQSQDLTRQQLEKVIEGLQDLQNERAVSAPRAGGAAGGYALAAGPREEGRHDG